MTSRYLIRGGCVLTLAAKTPNFPEADVLVEDGRITEVGPRLRARDAEVVDAADAIVMPGFVDSHRHLWKTLFRNLGTTGSNALDPELLTPEDVYAAALIGLLGAAAAGITTVVDWADVAIDEARTDALLHAYADAGLRTVLIHPVPTTRTDPGAELRTLAGRMSTDGALTTLAVGSPDLSRANQDRIADDWQLARELGLRIHAHAGIDAAEAGFVAEMAGMNLLGDDVTLVHCTHLSDLDLDAVAAGHASVAVTPAAEMANGLGSPPLQKLLDRRIEPGLGVDDELVAPGDMFVPMRAGNSIQHAAYFDLKLAGKAGLPNLLTTRDVIGYATGVGARAAGLGAVTGSLEPGKQADLVVFRTGRRNIYPVNDPIGAVVWGMDPSNVDWVFAAGHPVVRAGTPVADAADVRTGATAARDRVMAAAGARA